MVASEIIVHFCQKTLAYPLGTSSWQLSRRFQVEWMRSLPQKWMQIWAIAESAARSARKWVSPWWFPITPMLEWYCTSGCTHTLSQTRLRLDPAPCCSPCQTLIWHKRISPSLCGLKKWIPASWSTAWILSCLGIHFHQDQLDGTYPWR